jgi:histidinol-phosphatase (PHP family)
LRKGFSRKFPQLISEPGKPIAPLPFATYRDPVPETASPLAALADYHTHTPLCRHAEGWPVDLARVAAEKGLGEFGLADHNPMPKPFDDWRMLIEDLPRYLESVEAARAEFPQLNIKLGLECDYLRGQEEWIEKLAGMASWDFFIGSVHYLPDGWEVDNPKYLSRHTQRSAPEMWDSYWETYGACIRSGLFDFVGHPDLPKKFGVRPDGDLRRYYEPAIQALLDTGISYEINTAGLRKECKEQYPAVDFIQLACSAGVPVLINSDAHHPDEVAAGFDTALQLARQAGYTHTVRFSRRRRSIVALP